MAIRAVREIAELSQALDLYITSCKLPASSAIEAFKQWNSNFTNKAAFDFKIFKGVKKNFRAIQNEIKNAQTQLAKSDFVAAGLTLAKIESFIVSPSK